jgi:hypothetical protein
MNQYLSYILTLFVVVPAGALIAQYAIIWMAGFKPRYLKALLSTIVAYAIATVLGLVFCTYGPFQDVSRGFQILALWSALTCTHINMVRNNGQVFSPLKAVIVALCQILGAMIVGFLVILFVGIIKRLFH